MRGGVKNWQNIAYVVYGWPLNTKYIIVKVNFLSPTRNDLNIFHSEENKEVISNNNVDLHPLKAAV